jgi:hypothetical protein
MSKTEYGYRQVSKRGSLYSEMTNKGRSSTKYVRGAKPIRCVRWVADIVINGKRYRMRSTDYNNCRRWLDDMIEKAGGYVVRYRKRQTWCEKQKERLKQRNYLFGNSKQLNTNE